MDESELIRACQNQDRAAQRRLYDSHVEHVFRLAMRLAGNEQDALDITQDAFIKCFSHLQSFNRQASIRTWLYRIATNEALQLFRRRKTESKHLQRIAESTPQTEPAATENLASAVAIAVDALPHEWRTVLILKYQEQLSYADIAQILGVSPGTVASRLNRAREQLKRRMTQNKPGRMEEMDPELHPTD